MMSSVMLNESQPSLTDLQARIAPELAAIDLSRDLTPRLEKSIAIAELSGTAVSEYSKKLSVLVSRGVITHDECRALTIAFHTR